MWPVRENHAEGLAERGSDVKLSKVLWHSQVLNGLHYSIPCAGRGRLQPDITGLSIYGILYRGTNKELGDISQCQILRKPVCSSGEAPLWYDCRHILGREAFSKRIL